LFFMPSEPALTVSVHLMILFGCRLQVGLV
jgi:hypothetical protein